MIQFSGNDLQLYRAYDRFESEGRIHYNRHSLAVLKIFRFLRKKGWTVFPEQNIIIGNPKFRGESYRIRADIFAKKGKKTILLEIGLPLLPYKKWRLRELQQELPELKIIHIPYKGIEQFKKLLEG